MRQGIRNRLSYANVASTLALFVALGGTSYAVASLPRNSVGAKQLRTGAVRSAEVHRGAVRSSEIRDGAVRWKDIRASTRTALRGQPGPPGPAGAPAVSYFIVADAAGRRAAGNGGVIEHPTTNGFLVQFPRAMTGCALVATPARVPSDASPSDPTGGSTATVAHEGPYALVRTFDERNQAKALPFALIAAC